MSEESLLDLALEKLKIDFKLKAEILIKVRNFVVNQRKDQSWNEKAGMLMKEIAQMIADGMIEYAKLEKANNQKDRSPIKC